MRNTAPAPAVEPVVTANVAPTPKVEERVAPPPPEESMEDLGITAPGYGVRAKQKRAHVPVMQYRVERGPGQNGEWPIVHGGGKTFLGPGKIIDARMYDIDKLVRQGVVLTKLGES
jgi:hypothetical protein